MSNVTPFNSSSHASALLDTNLAARFLGVSASFLNKSRVTGDGPQFCKIGRRVLYDRRDLELWLDARRFGSTSEAQFA